MLLPKDINRIKGATQLGDYLIAHPGSTLVEKEKLQSYLISPALDQVLKSNPIDADSFRIFCESRARAMMDHIVQYITVGK